MPVIEGHAALSTNKGTKRKVTEAAEKPVKETVPSMLDTGLVDRAVSALLKLLKDQAIGAAKEALFEDGEYITVQLALRKLPGRISAKPILIQLPNPLLNADDCAICLITKDNAKKDVKKQLEETPVSGLTQINTLTQMRKEYSQFKDRRELTTQFDLFLCDDRIIEMMAKTLGKTFFKIKKQPAPVSLTKPAKIATLIKRARDSTFLYMSYGQCWAFKAARSTMTAKQITDNLTTAIAQVVNKIPGKWANIQAMHIKTPSTLALPIYISRDELKDLDLSAVTYTPRTEKRGSKRTAEDSEATASGSSTAMDVDDSAEAEGKRGIKSQQLREDLRKLALKSVAATQAAAEQVETAASDSPDDEEEGAVTEPVAKKSKTASAVAAAPAADSKGAKSKSKGKGKAKASTAAAAAQPKQTEAAAAVPAPVATPVVAAAVMPAAAATADKKKAVKKSAKKSAKTTAA